MKKILFLVASMLIGITMQLTAQQNGVAVVPIPSSEANSIYYFIESAYNGTTGAKPTTGTSSQGNVIYSQTTDGQNAKHDAVGSITNVYDVGLWRLTASGSNYIIKNKTYGYLNTSVNPTIVDLQATTITNTLTRYVNAYQYNMKSGSQNPVVAWHTDARGNYLDRYYDQGVNSRSAWYFVLPKDNIDIAIANANGYMNNTTAGNDVGQYSAKTRILLQSAIDVATANKNDGDDTNNADAANVLNSEIVKYYNAKNLVKIETPALIINKATDARLDLALKFTLSGSVPNSVKVGTGNAIIWKLAKSTTSYNGHAIVCNVSGTDYYVQANLTLGTTLYEKWVIEEKTYSGVTGVRFALYEGTGGALSAVLHQSNNGPNYAVMNYTGDDMASLWKVDNGRDLLGTTLTKTNAIINSTIESDEFGQLTTAKRTNLVSAKDAATTVYINTTLTASDYYPSFVTLNNALTNNPVNTDKNAFTSADENKYKWYTIRSTGTATYVANKVISSNGRVLSNKFTFENPGTPITDAQLFRFEISGNDIIIINKANGHYMAANGAISTSSTTFTLNLLTDGYSFNIKPASADAIHAQDAGSAIVNWAGNAGSASAWVFDYQKTTPKVPEFSGTGNWSTAANWVDNALPNTYNDVIINGSGEALLDADATVKAVTIYSGKTLTLTPGKKLQVAGQVDNAQGTLNVNGTLQFNAGSWVTNAPVYGTGSALIYNTGGTYGRGAEWGTTSPASVQLSNNTTLNYPNGSTPNLTLTGNLTIDNGSALYMDYSSGSGSLTVGGNVLLNGNLSLGSASGGDILVGGNWTKTSTSSFDANNRAVIFNGTTEQTVTNDGGVYPYVVIEAGSKVTLATGKTWEATNFTINSNATMGTGTFVNNGTLTNTSANVQQHLYANRLWWYMSSPLSGASSSIFGTDKVGKYVEDYITYPKVDVSVPYYTDPFSNAETLTVGRGYIIKRATTTEATYTFTGGTLNNGNYTLTPTRTGTSAGKRGFNLVGNPYPSYLNWDAAYTDTQNPQSNMRNAIWYRTYSGGAMVFHTYANEESVPLGANGMIPPMQAFWVKVKADGSNGSITFKNAYRSHATGSTFPLKAKAMTKTQRLRLLVSNGTNTDETLIVGKSYASAAYDEYDTEKMSNNNAAIPEIYSIAESQELVINSVNQLAEGETIPLGLRPGQAGSFSIEATQLDNIDAQVVLVDKLTGAKTELTAGISYNFISDGTATNNRFSIEFRAPGMTTGFDNNNSEEFNITVYSGKIQIQSPAMANGELIRVYSSNGQKIMEQTAEANNTIIDHKLSSGVYFVKVSNYVQKIIIQ